MWAVALVYFGALFTALCAGGALAEWFLLRHDDGEEGDDE
jgi:hypothetical protein